MYRCESFNKIFTQKVPGVLTKTNDEIIKIDDNKEQKLVKIKN